MKLFLAIFSSLLLFAESNSDACLQQDCGYVLRNCEGRNEPGYCEKKVMKCRFKCKPESTTCSRDCFQMFGCKKGDFACGGDTISRKKINPCIKACKIVAPCQSRCVRENADQVAAKNCKKQCFNRNLDHHINHTK